LRVAAISHSCVIDVNQQIYADLLRYPDVDLLLIAPERWYSSLRGDITFSALPALEQAAHALPVRFQGHIHFHWYEGLGPVLGQFSPDILYLDEEPYSLVSTQALAWRNYLGCKLVFYTKQNLPKRYLPPFSWMQSRILQASDHAMVVSQEAAEVLRRKGYAGPTTELPHGVDPQQVPKGDSADLRNRLGVQGPAVGYVGRIANEKGVWDLLQAVRILVDRLGQSFSVVMIGDGPARWKLEDAVERTLPPGLVTFTGSVAHHAVPDYLNMLDVLVLPSRTQRHWKEQFGRVLVEALACGTPIVGSTSGHIPAVIESTGGGVTFREGDVHDMADKVERLLSDQSLAHDLAASGQAAVLERYSYHTIAGLLHGALTDALRGGA